MKLEKQILIDELLERIQQSPFLLVVDYQGLTVSATQELRNRLKAAGARATVTKNTFVKRALKDAGLPDISADLVGQTMTITGEDDVTGVAKVLKAYTAQFKKLEFKTGILRGQLINAEQMKTLADLPSREELLATLLSVINAPASKLVRTINEPAASLARVIKAYAEKA